MKLSVTSVILSVVTANTVGNTRLANSRDLILLNPPINSENTCGSRSLWSDWQQDSDCCNGPEKNRRYFKRTCQRTDCQCLGASSAYLECAANACIVPTPGFCYWTGWSAWDRDGCIETGSRSCQTNLADKACCVGSPSKTRVVAECMEPITQIWSEWSSWSNCMGQTQTRTASCNSNQDPMICQGTLSERRDCLDKPFIIWGNWGAWSTCIGDRKQRTRPCEANDAYYCQGPLTASQICTSTTPDVNNSFCTVAHKWSLDWCLQFNFGCAGWYRNDYVMSSQQCFQYWSLSTSKINKFYQVFGGYVY